MYKPIRETEALIFLKNSNADLLVIDEPEVRLGLSERYLKISDIICHDELSKYKDLVVTRGIKGLLIKDFKTKNKFFNFPALTSNVGYSWGRRCSIHIRKFIQ